LVQQAIGSQMWVAGFHGLIYNCTKIQYKHANSMCKPIFRSNDVQLIPQAPAYLARFAAYITLGIADPLPLAISAQSRKDSHSVNRHHVLHHQE